MKKLLNALLFHFTASLRILVAGDMDDGHRLFFELVAERLSEQHDVFVLTKNLDLLEQKIIRAGYTQLGFSRFTGLLNWDPKQTELENYRRLDQETLRCWFHDIEFALKLREFNFDVGIGGLNQADSFLFSFNSLPHIKLSEEDVESSVMQIKLGMPVLTSTYPSAQVWPQFQDLPNDFSDLAYRWLSFRQYQLNKWDNHNHLQAIRKILTIVPGLPDEFLTDLDQDHALVVGQGATAGLFQSIMLKPPNIVDVYPLEPDHATINKRGSRTVVTLPSEWTGHVVVFNIEAERPDDLMSTYALKDIRLQIVDLLKRKIPVVIMANSETGNSIRDYLQHKHGLILFVESKRAIFDHKAKLIFVGTCRQRNIINAVELGAIFVGYSHPLSHTQQFNCKKLTLFQVGFLIQHGELKETLVSHLLIEKELPWQNVNWYKELLSEKRLQDKMDLEYWVDYLKLFGVKHKIPTYDKMSNVVWFNLDLVTAALLVTYVCYRMARWWFRQVCRSEDKVKLE